MFEKAQNEKSKVTYDFTNLWSTQFFGFYQFKNFLEFASDKSVQIDYLKSRDVIWGNENGEGHAIMSQVMIDFYLGDFADAVKLIKNQFIVFLFTRYEFVIQDTVKCLINDEPQRLLKILKIYPDYEKTLGFCLKDFINCPTKEEYIALMSERFANKILSGRPSTVLGRLRCLLTFKDIDGSVLDEIMDRRNKIVHEGHLYDMKISDLEFYYEAIENLLTVLATALKKVDIYVKDEGQILNGEYQ